MQPTSWNLHSLPCWHCGLIVLGRCNNDTDSPHKCLKQIWQHRVHNQCGHAEFRRFADLDCKEKSYKDTWRIVASVYFNGT